MNLILETERLLLRPIEFSDAKKMFLLDSNANVVKYLGNKPVKSVEQITTIIEFIKNQYVTNGIGRFAVILKETDEFIGWSGLKFITEPENNHVNFYDIGYRFREEFWQKGYAHESAVAWRNYGFNTMKIPIMYASAHVDNIGSNKILQKIGMTMIEQFIYEDFPCNWYEMHNINTK